MDTFLQDFRYALRQLRRAPALSLAVVVTLAVAIGAATTLFSVLNAIVLRTLPVLEPNRLALVSITDRNGVTPGLIHYTTYRAFAAEQQLFERHAMYSGGAVYPIEGRGTLTEGAGALVTPDFFRVMELQPFLGRLITSEDAPNTDAAPARVAVLGYRLWQRLYSGDPGAIGDRLLIDGSPVTIVGVLRPDFIGVHVDHGSDFYIPLTLSRHLSGNPQRPIRAYTIVGRLRPGVTLDRARAAIASAWPALTAATLPPGLKPSEEQDLKAQRVRIDSAATGISNLRQRYADPITILVGLAIVLLCIGCANLSGLLLGRTVSREQQLAVCLALGATRFRLVRLLMIESVLLSAAGAIAAVPIAWAASSPLGAMLWVSASVPRAISLTPDARVLAILSAATIAIGLVIGALPAIAAGRQDPQRALQRGRTMSGQTRRWGRTLIVAQVALSLVLLFGAGLFASSIMTLRGRDVGFRPDGLIFTRAWQIPGPAAKYDEQAYYPALVERLSALPGVQSVSLSTLFPVGFNIAAMPTQRVARAETADARSEVDGAIDYISPRFFETIGGTILRGRDFAWTDRSDSTPVVIISSSLARALFPDGDAIGRRIRIGADPRRQSLEVIGVVSELTVGNLRAPQPPVAYRPRLQEPQAMRLPIVTLRVTGDMDAITTTIGPAIRSLGREYVRWMVRMDDHINASLQQERLLAGLSAFFGALAALLAFVGLYGMLAHAVTRRTREIGVRMAIGATRAHVMTTIVREAIVVTLIGIAIGVPAALWASRLTGGLIYGLTPTDPRILAGAALLLFSIGLAAGLLPARRASSIDPMTALRCE